MAVSVSGVQLNAGYLATSFTCLPPNAAYAGLSSGTFSLPHPPSSEALGESLQMKSLCSGVFKTKTNTQTKKKKTTSPAPPPRLLSLPPPPPALCLTCCRLPSGPASFHSWMLPGSGLCLGLQALSQPGFLAFIFSGNRPSSSLLENS